MRRTVLTMLTAGALTAALALPAPTTYTLAMFGADIESAHIVALVQVVALDTSGTTPSAFEDVTLKVLKVYKGGLNGFDSTIRDSRALNLVGWYAPNYAIGQRAIVCCADGAHDGIHLRVNTRGTFTLTASDSVTPPPVGLGFSSDFLGYLRLADFEGLLVSTIVDSQFLEFSPVLPRADQTLTFRSRFMIACGAVINSVTVDPPAAASVIRFIITYTPCTGVCPNCIRSVDTSLTISAVAPGTYTAYRYVQNSLLVGPALTPDDSLSFTVYTSSAVRDQRRTGTPGVSTSRMSLQPCDIAGRLLPPAARSRSTGIFIADSRVILRPGR